MSVNEGIVLWPSAPRPIGAPVNNHELPRASGSKTSPCRAFGLAGMCQVHALQLQLAARSGRAAPCSANRSICRARRAVGSEPHTG